MKIGKIILIVLGIALIALGVKGLMDIPGQPAALHAAVYLDKPVVSPENEGKRVILHGKAEMIAPAYDEELRMTINSIKAVRHKEVYKQTGDTEKELKWEWVTQGQQTLLGQAKIGDFELDADLLNAFPTESNYVDFDAYETRFYTLDRANKGSGDLYVLPVLREYEEPLVVDGEINSLSVEAAILQAQSAEGGVAYKYRAYDPAKNGEHTVVGIQQGSRIEKDDTLGAIVRSGVMTKEQVLSSNKGGIIGGAAVFMLIGAVLVFLGIRKPKKAAL